MQFVIFDRSIFHGNKFSRLAQSNILNHIRENKIRVYYTPGFIEETLQFGLNHRDEFKKQFIFLLKCNPYFWFRSADQIVEAELGLKYSHPLYYLWKDEEISSLIGGIQYYLIGRYKEIELQGIIEKTGQYRLSREKYREEILNARKSIIFDDPDFNSHFEKHCEWFIENVFMKHYPDSTDYLMRWKSSREFCIFTENILRCWIATAYLPIENHSLQVHINDIIDAFQLAYLSYVDIVVSDDTRFMKDAFNILFKNNGKQLFTLSEFLEFQNHL